MWKKKRGKWICWLHDAAVTLTLFRLCRSLDYKTSYSPPLMIYIYTYTFFCFFLSALVVGFTSSCWERRRRNSCYVWCSFFFLQCIRVCVSPFPLESKTLPKLGGVACLCENGEDLLFFSLNVSFSVTAARRRWRIFFILWNTHVRIEMDVIGIIIKKDL